MKKTLLVHALTALILGTCALGAQATDYVHGMPDGLKAEHDVAGPTFEDTVTINAHYTGAYKFIIVPTDSRHAKVKTQFTDVWLTSKVGTWHIANEPDAKFWFEQGKPYVLHLKGTTGDHGSYALIVEAVE